MSTILHTDKLCKSFSNGGLQQHVIKNLDLEIREKDFTVIMGASGSGKSTLLYALSGMDTPTLGRVFFGDKDISKYTNDQLAVFRRENCGFVFQSIYLLENMTVFDNIMTGALVIQKNSPELVKKTEELLKKVGIGEKLWDKYPNQLSGGECQRVGIVRAVINDPKILFADEPTGALNKQNSEEVMKELNKLNEDGTTIMMVTHDVKVASRCERVFYIEDGNIREEKHLGKYKEDMARERERELNNWLMKLGW